MRAFQRDDRRPGPDVRRELRRSAGRSRCAPGICVDPGGAGPARGGAARRSASPRARCVGARRAERLGHTRARRGLRRHRLWRRRNDLGRRAVRREPARTASSASPICARPCFRAAMPRRDHPGPGGRRFLWRRSRCMPDLSAAPFEFPTPVHGREPADAASACARFAPLRSGGFSIPWQRCSDSLGASHSKGRPRCGSNSSRIVAR